MEDAASDRHCDIEGGVRREIFNGKLGMNFDRVIIPKSVVGHDILVLNLDLQDRICGIFFKHSASEPQRVGVDFCTSD